jgi:hypothetical protein
MTRSLMIVCDRYRCRVESDGAVVRLETDRFSAFRSESESGEPEGPWDLCPECTQALRAFFGAVSALETAGRLAPTPGIGQ